MASRKLPDSGKRAQFASGAVRELPDDYEAVEGISPFAVLRLGRHLHAGGIKYGDFRNWEKGMPWTRMVGAIIRHAFKYLARRTDEDHLAAIMWNAQALMHYEETGAGEDDRPVWPRG